MVFLDVSIFFIDVSRHPGNILVAMCVYMYIEMKGKGNNSQATILQHLPPQCFGSQVTDYYTQRVRTNCGKVCMSLYVLPS